MALGSLDTVTDYVTAARIITQDVTQPYRYPDADFLAALSWAVMESRRLRPDMWANVSPLPSFANNDSTAVNIDPQYRTAFVLYMAGMAQLRDEEETQDTHAAALMQSFKGALVTAL